MQLKEEPSIKSKLKELASINFKDICQERPTGVGENIKNKIDIKILKLLGWDEDKDFDYEFPIRNKRADIALKYDKKVKVIVETKSIEKKLNLEKIQVLEYARSKGVDWAILTNGEETRLYKSFISGVTDERNKPILTILLENLETDFWRLYNFVGKENFNEIEVKTKDEIKIIKEKIEAEDILFILTENKEKLTKNIKERFEREYTNNSEFKEKIDTWINETNLNVNAWLDKYKEDKNLREKVDRILKDYKIDILYYFIAQGINLLKHRGLLSYITTRYWLEATYSKKLRKFILENCCIKAIVDFRDVRIFEGASNHTCLLFLQREEVVERKEENAIKVVIVKKKMEGSSIEIQNEKLLLHIRRHFKEENYSDGYIEIFDFDQSRLTEEPWIFVREEKRKIIEKIKDKNPLLEEVGITAKGMETGLNEVFIANEEIIKQYKFEKEILVKLVRNNDINKYYVQDANNYELPKEEKKLKEEIESIEKEFNKIVYGLYGIEKEEIEIIDNKGENL